MLCLNSTVNGHHSDQISSIVLEKYVIGKVIGDGNFAVVRECVERYVHLNEPVGTVVSKKTPPTRSNVYLNQT